MPGSNRMDLAALLTQGLWVNSKNGEWSWSHRFHPLTALCDFRTCGAGEKDDGWSKPACARGSCLGSGDIRCPVGRCGAEGPPSPAGDPSLEVTAPRAALSPCVPGQNQHKTEHIPGCNVHLHLPISLSTSRQIRLLLRDPLYSVLYIWGHWPKPNPS